jgi:hypothetical protein
MQMHPIRALALALLLCGLLPATVLAAGRHAPIRPHLGAPERARVGTRITVRGTGLKPGRYTVLLVKQITYGPSPTFCTGRLGSAAARHGRVTITGRLPRRLACRSGQGMISGYATTRPGAYKLDLGILEPPAGFRISGSFLMRTIHLVR